MNPTEAKSFIWTVFFCIVVVCVVAVLMSFPARAAENYFDDNFFDTPTNVNAFAHYQEFHVKPGDPVRISGISINAGIYADTRFCIGSGDIEALIGIGGPSLNGFTALYDCESSLDGMQWIADATCEANTATTGPQSYFTARCEFSSSILLPEGDYFFAYSHPEELDPGYPATTTNLILAGWYDGGTDRLPDAESCWVQLNYDGFGTDRVNCSSWLGGWISGDDDYTLLPFYDDTMAWAGTSTDATEEWLWRTQPSFRVNPTTKCEYEDDPCPIIVEFNDLANGYWLSLSPYDSEDPYNILDAVQITELDHQHDDDYYPENFTVLFEVNAPAATSTTEITSVKYRWNLVISPNTENTDNFEQTGPDHQVLWYPNGWFIDRANRITGGGRWSGKDSNLCSSGFKNTPCSDFTDVGCGLKKAGAWAVCPATSSALYLTEASERMWQSFPLSIVTQVRDMYKSVASFGGGTAGASIPLIRYGKNGERLPDTYLITPAVWNDARFAPIKYWSTRIIRTFLYLFTLMFIINRVIRLVSNTNIHLADRTGTLEENEAKLRRMQPLDETKYWTGRKTYFK